MNIIQINSSATGSRPPIQSWSGAMPPRGYAAVTPDCDTSAMQTHSGFVDLTIEGGVVTAITGNEEAYQAYLETIKPNIEEVKNSKFSELSSACNTAIEKGTTIQLSDGASENFSYTLADQANVSEMFNAIVMGATEYPYHANDSECKMYSAKDIITIYSTLSSMKTAQITYHNQLKQYVKSLENADEIQAVKYGQELTGEYLEAYNTLIAQAQTQLEAVLARIVSLENV